MAEKSGFFNALYVDGEYDRTYNADDYTDSLAVVIANGVLRSENDDLKVTSSGMTVSVAEGWGWIKGHYYHNDSALTLVVPTAPNAGSRIDRVMLRFDNSIQQRKISVVYVQGSAANQPVAPSPTRSQYIYDLVLADVTIAANATGVTIKDQRANSDVCGWVYSTSGDSSFFKSLDNDFNAWFTTVKDTVASVTLFKRYSWRTVLTAETNQVQFDIPQFDEDTCFIEVYVNGLLDTEGVEYTRSGNVLTGLGLPLVVGTEIEVKCYKSIDGTGIMSVADEITALQNSVATLDGVSKYTYKCTGASDNISLSQIAQAFLAGSYVAANVTAAAAAFLSGLGGNTYLAALGADAQIGIDVVGKCGAATAYSGAGTSTSPYSWFALGQGTAGSALAAKRKIIFDFAKCDVIKISCAANTYNRIFYGADLDLRNARVQAVSTAAGCQIEMIDAGNLNGRVNCEDCNFKIDTSALAQISKHGTFTNCFCYVAAKTGAAYCFKPKSTGLIRLIGGEYYAYCLTSSGIGSAIIHTSAGDTDGTALAYNIHCPVVGVTNYSQGFLAVANAGKTYINGVVSRLTSSGSYYEVVGQVDKNKA